MKSGILRINQKIIKFYDYLCPKKNNSYFLYEDFVKVFFLTFMLVICSISFIILTYFSFWQYYVINDHKILKNIVLEKPIPAALKPFLETQLANLKAIPLSVRLLRTFFAFVLVWYLFFSIWSIKIGWIYYKNKVKRLYCFLLFFNFLCLLACLNLFYIYTNYYIKTIVKEKLKAYFGANTFLKTKYPFFSWNYNILLIQWLLFLPILVFIFYNPTKTRFLTNNWSQHIIYQSFWYFTYQINLLAFVFLSLRICFPYSNLFYNNLFHLIVASLLAVVGLGWNGVLLPSFIRYYSRNNINWYAVINGIWLHIITPLTFTCTSIYLITKSSDHKKASLRYSKLIFYTLTYPLLYSLFIILLPFISGLTPYGWLSNTNPNLATLVIKNDVIVKYFFGNGLNLFFYLLTYFLIIISTSLFYVCDTFTWLVIRQKMKFYKNHWFTKN